MENTELLNIISRDEDSKHQFKSNVNNEISLSQEMIAFSNSLGGLIVIGIDDNGEISGLARRDMGRLSNLVSNAASQQTKPPINPITENLSFEDGLVMIIHIPQGISKPYMDKNGVIWVKSGADKRKATSREEIQRMYQSAGLIHGDEIPVVGMSVSDIDQRVFYEFYEKQFGESYNEQNLSIVQIFNNLNLSTNEGKLNIAGALLFGKNTAYRLPTFIVKCMSYPLSEIDIENYIDSQDISGTLKNIFDDTLGFILRNTRRVQNKQSINSLGELEIPNIVFEELLANALIHRDYFISAPIRVLLFEDRVEIISPGHLPNNLSIENIKNGNSNIRNPILASFGAKILPYRGLGSGIGRALKAHKSIEFIDDRDGNFFKVVIRK